jgi:hypothetical protein
LQTRNANRHVVVIFLGFKRYKKPSCQPAAAAIVRVRRLATLFT